MWKVNLLKSFAEFVMTEVPLEEYILGTTSQIVKNRVDVVTSMTNKTRRNLEDFFNNALRGELVQMCEHVGTH